MCTPCGQTVGVHTPQTTRLGKLCHQYTQCHLACTLPAVPPSVQRAVPVHHTTLYTTPHCWQELKRKLEAAEDSDIVEQGKATLKSVKKELRLLQKAEEEHDQGESARSSPL